MQPLTEWQEKWLTALESGDYKQRGDRLRLDDEYCCLGVACDLFDDTRWNDDRYRYDGIPGAKEMMMPEDIVQAFGFRSSAGKLRKPTKVPHERGQHEGNAQSLVDLNDTFEWTFDQIAAFVRANPQLVFVTVPDGN
jgi:hypothetical protein